MPPAIVIDRYGRRIEPDDGVVPDGGRVVVAMPFMDSRSAHVGRAFGDGLLHAPGWAQQALIGDAFEASNSHERSQRAREEYIRGLSNSWQAMPRTPTRPRPGLAAYDPADAAEDGDPSELAYHRMKARLADAWRTPTRDDDPDDNAEGIATPDLPDDIAQLPLVQQQAFCAAWNKMAEDPSATEEDCEKAGRAAIAALGQDSSVYEAIRTDAQRRYAERIANAWKT